jgi:hypothetical protein
VIPVLLVTGPVGVGKSAVLHEADALLSGAEIPHATVVLEEIARCWPPATDDRRDDPIAYRNLASLWPNFAAQGAERLLLEQILEKRSQIRHLRAALPAAAVTVVRLHAPLSLIEERLRMREPYPESELGAARWLAPRMDHSMVEDHVVENGRRPLREVASEVLQSAHWLP